MNRHGCNRWRFIECINSNNFLNRVILSNNENSEFLWFKCCCPCSKGSEATIKDTTIKTNASGANAAFATGENAVINVSNKLPQLEIHHVV